MAQRGPHGRQFPGSNRARAVQDWLARRADTAVGRLALQWFHAYFAASRNSGCAASIYSAFSALPFALAIVAVVYAPGDQTNVFAEHLVDHLRLTGSTASLVRDTFGTASSNALAVGIASIVSFLLWGLGIGQIYQDVYSRAWGVKVGSVADQGLFAIFFFVFAGALALVIIVTSEFEDSLRLALVPVWFLGSTLFWLWVPRFLLHRKIGLRALLPGALLGSFVLTGASATSPLFLAGSFTTNGKAFGSLGIVLTVVGWLFIMITMSLVCAVFSPVWAEWRRGEKERKAAQLAPAPAAPGT
jgi:membrane protein